MLLQWKLLGIEFHYVCYSGAGACRLMLKCDVDKDTSVCTLPLIHFPVLGTWKAFVKNVSVGEKG